MTRDESSSAPLDRLLSAYCDENLAISDWQQVESMLLENESATKHFVCFLQLHALAERFTETESIFDRAADDCLASNWPTDLQPAKFPAQRILGAFRGYLPRSAVGMTALLAVTIYGVFGLLVWQMSTYRFRPSNLDLVQSEGDSKAEIETPVATLVQSVGCTWDSEHSHLRSGDKLKPGMLWLQAGAAEFKFNDGARVKIEGPTRFELVSTGSGILQLGKLAALVPKRAVGFSVQTPSARIIDVGTEFGLEVLRTGVSDVHVFQGAVLAEFDQHGDGRSVQRIRLNKSEGARFALHASVNRFTAAPERFPLLQGTGTKSAVNQQKTPIFWIATGSADWNIGSNWQGGLVPGSFHAAGIRNGGTAEISSRVPNVMEMNLGWNEDASNPAGYLRIVPGGSLIVAGGNADIGVRRSEKVSVLTVAGGTLTVLPGIELGHLIIGDEVGSKGEVKLTSGSILATRSLRSGAGRGKLTIVGTRGTLTVGGDLLLGATVGSGELAIAIDETGITAMDVGGNTLLKNATFNVSLIGRAPATNLVLINCAVGGHVSGTFVGVPDEGPVSATIGDLTYHWLLSYNYDADTGVDGSGDDVALKFVKVTPKGDKP